MSITWISTTFLLHHLAPFLYHLYLFCSFASSSFFLFLFLFSFSSVFKTKTKKHFSPWSFALTHGPHGQGLGTFSSHWQHLCLPGQHWPLFKFLNLPLTGSRPDSLTAKATCLTQSQFKNKNDKVKDSDSECLWGKKMACDINDKPAAACPCVHTKKSSSND